MIELSEAITLREAARGLPPARAGRPVSVSCLMRWVKRGVRTPGRRVYLKAVRLGGRWLTSRRALSDFAREQTPRQDGCPGARAGRARQAATRAEEELDRLRL